jgi:hypothetical protein
VVSGGGAGASLSEVGTSSVVVVVVGAVSVEVVPLGSPGTGRSCPPCALGNCESVSEMLSGVRSSEEADTGPASIVAIPATSAPARAAVRAGSTGLRARAEVTARKRTTIE